MTKKIFQIFAFGMLTAAVAQVSAQPPGPGGPGPGGGRPVPPVMAALDADSNGEVSAKEIENASKALAALDKNKDGKLSEDELRPEMGRPGEGRGGPGGPGGGFAGGRGPNAEEMFTRMDTNKDGKISKDEIPERMQEFVARADADKDGSITKEEITKMLEERGRAGGPGGPGGPGGGFGPPNAEGMVARMMRFDADKDEKLSKEELTKYAEEASRFFGGGRERGGDRPGRPDGEGADRPKRPQ